MELRVNNHRTNFGLVEYNCAIVNPIGMEVLNFTIVLRDNHKSELFVEFKCEGTLGFFFNILNALQLNKTEIIEGLNSGLKIIPLLSESDDKFRPKRNLRVFSKFNYTILSDKQIQDVLSAQWYVKDNNIIIDITSLSHFNQNEKDYVFTKINTIGIDIREYMNLDKIDDSDKHFDYEDGFFISK